MKRRCHYGRGCGGGTARGMEAVLGATALGRMGSGSVASGQRREMKEERPEWAARAGWASFRNGKRK
jgi:hypothetical protein